MKFLDKLALKVFSIIIVFLLVIITFIALGILPVSEISNTIARITDTENGVSIALGVGIVLLLLAFKGLFFTSKPPDDGKNGIVLENNSGKLVLSKESLENLIANVVKEVPGANVVTSKTFVDKNKNLVVYLVTTMSKDVMIKDVSKELQDRIKEAMKRTADLDVGEINIKVKSITSKKVKGLPEPVLDDKEEQDKVEEVAQDSSEENKED